MNCVLAFGPEGFKAAEDDLVVSLTPEASFFFERQGIPYRLMTDFYPESELFGQEQTKTYFKTLIEFMTEMDMFFQQHSRLCREFNIPLCSVNYMKIAYAMDTVNINGWILERFFEANPGIKHVSLLLGKAPIGEDSPSFFFFRASRKAVYAKVLERICAKRGISFMAVRPALNAQTDPVVARSPLKRALDAAKDRLKIPYRYLSYRKFKRRQAASYGSLLFLHHGAYEIDHFIRQAIALGVRTFVREERRIILESSAFRTAFTVKTQNDPEKLREDLRSCAEDIRKRRGAWFTRLNGACLWEGAAEILCPLFVRYTEDEAYRMLLDAQAWKHRIQEDRIDMVLGRGNTDLDSLAVLIAARHLCLKKTVCIQHAPCALEGEAMNVYDSVTFDYILARDPITYAYFKAWDRDASKLGWSGHYLNRLRQASKRRPLRRPEKIAYLPKKFHEDIRCMNEYSYSYVWYYQWQKQIMNLFARLKPRAFVYKHVPLQGWASRSIVPYIRALGTDNIEIIEAPFFEVIHQFDRVITDYPSGAFFEALACGKSVLCVHPSHFQINPEAMRLAGQCFAPFDTIEESLAAIEKFVMSDADAYRAELPLVEMDLMRLISNVNTAPAGQAAAAVNR